MQLLISVVRSGEPEARPQDLIVAAQSDSTVGDLAAVLANRLPAPVESGALRLVVEGGERLQEEACDLWVGSTLLDPQAPLGGGPVHDGMLLGLGGALADDVEPGGVVELRVVSGRGAGAVHRLSLGRYTLGGPGCDIALEGVEEMVASLAVQAGGQVLITAREEVAQRMAEPPHPRRRPLPGPLVLATEAGQEEAEPPKRRKKRRRDIQEDEAPHLEGREELDPAAHRHLVELERRPLEEETLWEAGAVLTVGECLLTVGAVPGIDAVMTPTPGATTIDFNRPPRLARPVRRTEFSLPRKPQPPRKPPIPFALMISPMVMGLGMYLMTRRVFSLMFMVLSPIMMIANQVQGRSSSKKTYRDQMKTYEEQREATENAAFVALTEERRLRRLDSPDPAEVMLRATGPRADLWERRPRDPDWLELRVGTADLASDVVLEDPERPRHEEKLRWTAPDVPVTLQLAALGVVGIAGAQRDLVSIWMAAQAAALHSPAELEMVLIMDPGQEEAARERWAWARWLPHLRNPEGMGARARIGADDESVMRRINELADLVEARSDKDGGRGAGGNQILVVLDGAHALRQRPGMIRVLRDGPAVGIRVICIDAERTSLPEECRAVVSTGPGLPSVSQTDVDEVEHVLLDQVPAGWCERVARALAPVHDVSASGAEGAIPSSSRLLDVLPMPEPEAQTVLRAWERVSRTTKALVGEDAEGEFWLDVRADGPHALVAGTTGSGKSELLQTIIASLCVGNTPESMTFVLVDYKGGAAFKDCARLPHTVGMVTDLDGHLTSRALESLGAELRRREHQLADADAKDIEDYVASMQPGDEPMPRLMIIIDEFAALVAELPDFVTGLVDIARRGRSLGVHLVLATQRPAGVVSAEIKSNTNLRIALRVTDEGDSQDVIEHSASAHIPPSLPGRAYARLGHASLRQFQSSRVGGRPRGATPRAELRAAELTLGELSRPEAAGPVLEEDATIPTDLATLVNAMGSAFASLGRPKPHSPWLPPLPEMVTLGELERLADEGTGRVPAPVEEVEGDGAAAEAGGVGEAGGADSGDPVAEAVPEAPEALEPLDDPRRSGFLPPLLLGLEDLPREQDQRPMSWDYTRAGHLGVAGGPRSGRSSLLRAIAVAVARTTSAAEVHIYGIDAGTGALLPCVSLPHVGAVVTRDQPERVRRLLALLGSEVSRRQQYLAANGFASLAEQRLAAGPEEAMSYLVLLIDRWDSFTATFESVDGGALLEGVETLMREGPAVGLRVVVAGDRTVFRGRFGMMLEDRLALKLPAAEDYEVIGMRAREVPVTMPVGRAFRTGTWPREVQLAMLTEQAAGTAQVAAIHEAGRESTARWGEIPRAQRPGRVDELPVTLSTREALDMGPELPPGAFSLAVGGDDLGLIPMAMDDIGNGVLVAGPRRSGRSTALAFGAQTALANGLSVALVLPRRSPLEALSAHPGVVGVLGLESTAADLEDLLRTNGPETLVVVDDYDLVGNDHVMCAVMEKHLRDCRDAHGGMLLSSGVEEAMAMYGGLMVRVKRARTGLVLAPRSSDDGTLLSARLPRSVGGPVPKGRGVMITTSGWQWVQVPRLD